MKDNCWTEKTSNFLLLLSAAMRCLRLIYSLHLILLFYSFSSEKLINFGVILTWRRVIFLRITINIIQLSLSWVIQSFFFSSQWSANLSYWINSFSENRKLISRFPAHVMQFHSTFLISTLNEVEFAIKAHLYQSFLTQNSMRSHYYINLPPLEIVLSKLWLHQGIPLQRCSWWCHQTDSQMWETGSWSHKMYNSGH